MVLTQPVGSPDPQRSAPAPRPAQPADVPAILGLIHELAAFERAADQVQTTEADLHELLFGRAAGAGPAAFCLVIDNPRAQGDQQVAEHSRDELAGMALWYLTTSTWTGRHGIHLEDLYVRPALRGRGYGAALMAALARICQDRGYPRLEWAVLDWNTPALQFYARLGAQPLGEWVTHRLAGPDLATLANRSAGSPNGA